MKKPITPRFARKLERLRLIGEGRQIQRERDIAKARAMYGVADTDTA